MSWNVYDKTGEKVKYVIHKLEYHGEFMGACSVTCTIESPAPIIFQIGDYLIFRGERFEINYDPSQLKKARIYSRGDAFVYENIKFNSLADELTRCGFLDYVKNDNGVHYSSYPKFSFYAENIFALVERIQVNLDRIYTGDKKWMIDIHPEYINTSSKNISVDSINCWDALALVNKEFGANFIIRERHIIVGTVGLPVNKLFMYGKEKGLYEIQKVSEDNQKIVTRLRAYGSTRNIPPRYYNKLKKPDGTAYIPESMYVPNLMLPAFPYETLDAYIDSPNIQELGVREGSIFFDGSSDLPEIYPSMEGMTAQQLIDAGINVSIDSGDNGNLDEIVSAEQITDSGTGEEYEENVPDFTITLKDIGFNIEDHLAADDAVISIKTGMCAGRDFTIVSCKKEGNKYILTCQRVYDESLKLYFPYKEYNIKPGDKFVLIGIEMPDVYVKAAGQKLLSASEEWLSKNDYVRYSYIPKIDNIELAKQHDEALRTNTPSIHDTIKEGDLLIFEDEDIGITGSIIIDSLVINEGQGLIPDYQITLRNEKVVGTLDRLQNQIDSISGKGGGQGSGGYNYKQIENIINVAGNRFFIRKDKPDETNYLLGLNAGATFGTYVGGFLGSGGKFDKDGYIEANGLTLREFLEVPELRFNRIDVVSGELWNSIAFGLIESVDIEKRIVTLKLEEGELSGLHVNDFCRGIFHNLTGNETSEGVDDAGFQVMPGFSTAYFTPVEIIDNAHFKYELKPGSTVHPCQSMKFAVYGNALEKSRQASAYSTRKYKRYLINVDTWTIDPSRNISYQEGDLSNLVINGETLEGGSVYLNNVYFGGNILTVGGIDNPLKGKDAYSVTLTTYSAVYNVADGIYEEVDIVTGDKNVVTGSDLVVASEFTVSTRIQASKGAEPLRFSNVIGEGKYVVTSEGVNCSYVITDGLVAVKEVTEDLAKIIVHVNCEGVAIYDVEFTIVRVKNGADGKDYEYIYTRTSDNVAPVAPSSEQINDYVPTGWTDDPLGPTLELPFEWVAKRVKREGIWGKYSKPSLWSRFGEDGTDYEYIYTRTLTETAPETPLTSQEDDYVPEGWTDDPVGPTSDIPFEWVCKRSKVDGAWGEYSVPALWSKYAEDGKDHEYIYQRTRTSSAPAKPATSQTDDYVPSGWTDDPSGVSATYPYEWVSKRDKIKGVWGEFSTPSLWAKYGENGRPGADGKTTYEVYRRYASQPPTPSGTLVPPSGWALDPPSGSTPLWMSKGVFNGDGSLYRTWSVPTKITGDPGPEGVPGPALSFRGEYSSTKQYTGNATRVEVVYVGSGSNKRFYITKPTAGVFVGQTPSSYSAYWTLLQGQFESIATGLLIAEEALISGWRFKENRIESQNNNCVLNGNADNDPKILIGATLDDLGKKEEEEKKPTKIYEDGRIETRKLIAKDGCTIGNMEVFSSFLRSSENGSTASFGTNVHPSITGMRGMIFLNDIDTNKDRKRIININSTPPSFDTGRPLQNAAIWIERGGLRIAPGNEIDIPGPLFGGHVWDDTGPSPLDISQWGRGGRGNLRKIYAFDAERSKDYVYTITHNLGHQSYYPVITPWRRNNTWNKLHPIIGDIASNYFTLFFVDSGTENAHVISGFSFVVFGYNTNDLL